MIINSDQILRIRTHEHKQIAYGYETANVGSAMPSPILAVTRHRATSTDGMCHGNSNLINPLFIIHMAQVNG